MRRNVFIGILIALAVVLATAACSASPTATPPPTATVLPPDTPAPPTPTPTATPRPVKLVFMAGFQPQANLPFVAAYVAKDKGYFAQEGLDVEIRHSTGQHLQLLASGDVQVTTADASSVLKRNLEQSIPIVAVELFGQKGQQAFGVLESSGIRSPKDWVGKTFGYKTSVPPDYLAILKAEGVDRSKIKEVSVSFDPRVLSEGKVDILAMFKSNEPDVLRSIGAPVRLFAPEDYGVPTLGLTYIVMQDYLATNREVVQRYVKATLRALQDIQADFQGALDITMRYAPQQQRDHMAFMLRAELNDAVGLVTLQAGIGAMMDAQWKAFADSLVEFQALQPKSNLKQAYDASLVNASYQNGRLVWP